MITSDQAWDLVNTYVNSKDCVLENKELFISHINGTEEEAYKTAWILFKKGYDINPDSVRNITTLHDLGRTVKKAYEDNNDIHEFWTGALLREEGFREEANIAQRHFVAFEKAANILVPRNYDINPEDYKQINLPEKILTYADCCIGSDGTWVKWKEKMQTMIPKYQKKNNPMMVNILQDGGLVRITHICLEVENLIK